MNNKDQILIEMKIKTENASELDPLFVEKTIKKNLKPFYETIEVVKSSVHVKPAGKVLGLPLQGCLMTSSKYRLTNLSHSFYSADWAKNRRYSFIYERGR